MCRQVRDIILTGFTQLVTVRESSGWRNWAKAEDRRRTLELQVPAVYLCQKEIDQYCSKYLWLGLQEQEYDILRKWCETNARALRIQKNETITWETWTWNRKLHYYAIKWRLLKLTGKELDFHGFMGY